MDLKLGMQVHCIGGQRESPASFRSGVGFLRLSYPRLVCVLFSGPSLLELNFFQKLFPHSFCSFGGVLNHFSNTTRFTSEYDITLQTNASSLATSYIEALLLTSEHDIMHTADKRVYR